MSGVLFALSAIAAATLGWSALSSSAKCALAWVKNGNKANDAALGIFAWMHIAQVLALLASALSGWLLARGA